MSDRSPTPLVPGAPARAVSVRGVSMHVDDEELALYVIGALDAVRCDAVESHVMECEPCAERLAREAWLEAAFDEVARRAIARPRLAGARIARRRNGRFMGGVAGALAAAAAIVLMFAQTSLAADQGASASQMHAGSYDGAAGDMSGALVGEVRSDKLDGG